MSPIDPHRPTRLTHRPAGPRCRSFPLLIALMLLGLGAGAKLTAQTPQHYESVYNSSLQGTWDVGNWGSPTVNLAAAAPGRTGNAIEVRTANGWEAFGFIDVLPGWLPQYHYLNEFATLEFDVYLESDSTGVENLMFILDDAGLSDQPHLVDYIPGWAGLTNAQRYGHWFHIRIDFAAIHPTTARFFRFLLFNYAAVSQPHFRVADVKLGWNDDITPPVVTLGTPALNATYDQLSLPFTTNEPAIYRVEYGVGSYNQILTGATDDWSTTHNATLTGLVRGSTYLYRVVALNHRTDPTAMPNQGTATGSYAIPAVPSSPPVISNLAIGGATGNRATLSWTTNRACSATVTYQKSGGTVLTRTFADLQSTRSVVLDLLEPSTAYTAAVSVNDGFSFTASQNISFASGAATSPTVTITANPAGTHAISPWIYGMNFYQASAGSVRNLTLNRQGGNRWTAYNWENNASNAGSDWGPYSNDNYLSSSTTPAEALRPLIVADRTRGTASLITVQMQGYVSADTNGLVNISDPNHLANRFKQVVFKKGSAFTLTPSTTDAFVYMDEFLWALDQKIPGDIYADPATPTFVQLDNEPELWPSTHAEIQTGAPTVAAYDQKTVSLCQAIKDLAPTAKTFGPVHYGFGGIVNWQGASGFSDTYWFTDKYLADLKAASQTAGRRLLDVYDFHWYSEAQGDGTRIVGLTGSSLTASQVQAIVQSPRSLWDPTYREVSWIADYLGGPVRILDRLQQKIDAVWPGTGLSITEYDNGGDNHIAGAIAQADNLGIFGQRGVFAASFWPMTDSYPFIQAGFKMYRDYDGALGSFGDISVPTVSSDTSKVAAYVSRSSSNAVRCVVVALNRSTASQDVAFAGLAVSGTARVYRLEGTATTPVFVGEVPVNLANWVVTLPALSVSTLEITTTGATAPVITLQPVDQTVAAGNPATFTAAASGTPAPTFQWQKGGVNINGATSSSYTIANAGAGDAGSYSVVATNSAGSVSSNAVTLTVLVAPFNAIITITIQ